MISTNKTEVWKKEKKKKKERKTCTNEGHYIGKRKKKDAWASICTIILH